VTTKWNKRGQACKQAAPTLSVLAPGRVNSAVPGPGQPVRAGARGTVMRDRNPMHDSGPLAQESGTDAIRPQKRLKGIS